MNGVLQTALQFYARSRTQRWLLAGALLLFTAKLLETRLHGESHQAWRDWLFIVVGVPGPALGATIAVQSATDFGRISAQRTVFLIPHSRLKLVTGMLLAQLLAGAVGSAFAVLVGHAEPLPPLAWGSARGTFEMLFGGMLSCAVLMQLMSGPSRVLSVASATLGVALLLRLNLFMQPEIFGLPKAHVLALAGMLVWVPFAAWYVIAWGPAAAPFAVWKRGADSAAAAVQVSRPSAIRTLLLGRPSLLRACRPQLAFLVFSHGAFVAMFMGMHLFIFRRYPPNYSPAIAILLYAPMVCVNQIAGFAARGSRRLWLRSGESRSMLYVIAARLGWQAMALLGIPFFGLALVEMYFLPHAGIDLVYALAVFMALTPGALYLGLLNFERRDTWMLMALMLAALGPAVARQLVESAQVRQLLWIVPAAFVALSGVLRELARRRWGGIDWLRFRAEREKGWSESWLTRS
jgi:hypothetical protein